MTGTSNSFRHHSGIKSAGCMRCTQVKTHAWRGQTAAFLLNASRPGDRSKGLWAVDKAGRNGGPDIEFPALL